MNYAMKSGSPRAARLSLVPASAPMSWTQRLPDWVAWSAAYAAVIVAVNAIAAVVGGLL